jgi:hypothetical protein
MPISHFVVLCEQIAAVIYQSIGSAAVFLSCSDVASLESFYTLIEWITFLSSGCTWYFSASIVACNCGSYQLVSWLVDVLKSAKSRAMQSTFDATLEVVIGFSDSVSPVRPCWKQLFDNVYSTPRSKSSMGPKIIKTGLVWPFPTSHLDSTTSITGQVVVQVRTLLHSVVCNVMVQTGSWLWLARFVVSTCHCLPDPRLL